MTTREAQVAETLVELADTLVADFDVVELMSLLTDRCVDVLDVDAAGIMLAGPQGELRVMASSPRYTLTTRMPTWKRPHQKAIS